MINMQIKYIKCESNMIVNFGTVEVGIVERIVLGSELLLSCVEVLVLR